MADDAPHPPRRRKLLRYTLYAVAAFAVVFAAAATWFALTFDPRAFALYAAKMVEEKTGRSLAIDGEVALSFWPDFGVRLGKVSMSERGGGDRFASIERVRVALALRPLLSREVVASELVVTGADVAIVRFGDGRLNIDDLFKGDGPPLQFDIGRVVVERSRVTFRDLSGGAQYEIGDIVLRTGRLTPRGVTPLDVAFVASSPETFRLSVEAKTELDLDLEAQRYGLSKTTVQLGGDAPGLSDISAEVKANAALRPRTRELHATDVTLRLKGKREQETISLALDAGEVAVTGAEARGVRVGIVLNASGAAGTTEAKLALPAVDRKGDAIETGAATLDFGVKRGDHAVSGTVSSPVEVSIAARALALPRLDADLTVIGPRLPRKGLRATLKGETRLDARKEGIDLKVAGKLIDSNVKARITAAGFAAPAYTFDLEVDRLDLDRITASSDKPAPRPSAAQSAQNLLEPLAKMPVTGTVAIGVLQSAGTKATNVRIVLK